MIRAAVLGSPISHSLSPVIHSAAYKFLDIEAQYSHFDVTSELLPEFLSTKLSENWRGFSLTMPLKETVLGLLASVDAAASRIASANTVLNVHGKWHGSSTDLTGFIRLFEKYGFERVAIIGGGGTARAAAGALADKVSGIQAYLRSPNRIDALQRAAGKTVVTARSFDLNLGSQLTGYDLIISTAPAGAVTLDHLVELSPQGILCEALYHPWPTPLASRWLEASLPLIDGIDLLVEEALDQIALFTERDFSFDQLRPHLLSVARAEQSTR